MERRSALLALFGWLLAAGAACAQVQVNAGGVSVQTSPGGGVWIDGQPVGGNSMIQRSYSYQSGDGSSVQRSYSYQSSGGSGVQRSYSYQSDDGDYADLYLDDDGPNRYYLVLQAPAGRRLAGLVRLNGRSIVRLDGNTRRIIPLSGLLRPGSNRIDLVNLAPGARVGVAGGTGVYGRGGNYSWLSQSSSVGPRTLMLTLGD